MAAQGKNPLRKNFMKMLDHHSICSSLYLTTFSANMAEHFSIFFKISCIPHPATVFCICFASFREHPVHPMRHLDPRKTIYIVQPEHDPQFALFYAAYVLLHLVGKFQELCLFLLQHGFPASQQHHLSVIFWYRKSFHNKVLCSAHASRYSVFYCPLRFYPVNLLF